MIKADHERVPEPKFWLAEPLPEWVAGHALRQIQSGFPPGMPIESTSGSRHNLPRTEQKNPNLRTNPNL
jgi:hypothetical protein